MSLNVDDPRFKELARRILQRHERGEPEANITSAVRNFLTNTGLANDDEISEEYPPSDSSRRAVDLTALDTFIEIKRSVSNMTTGFAPDPEYVKQLDDYLDLSAKTGKGVRTGILTDGKYWLLRWPGAGPVRTDLPYGFILDRADEWFPLYRWLRDTALVSLDSIPPTSENIEQHLGPNSPAYQRDIDTFRELFRASSRCETVKVKRQLWLDLLRSALGEIAGDDTQMDDLFVRHTYLTAVVGMVVQASFGIDIRALAETDPADLLNGRRFRRDTGLQGVVDSDFFAWPAEVGGLQLLKAIARRVARFDWRVGDIPNDIAAILYETVIPPDERRTLGEYYTPQWLAKAMTRELVSDPLNQSVLDPACGSGTFVAEAIANFIEAANESGMQPSEVFGKLRDSVTGIDVHPVAVHLARATYVLAARASIEDAGYTSVTVPIYLGDALQLRFRSGDLFAQHEITIQVSDEENTELKFPVSLVERPENFDALMGDIAESIEQDYGPLLALDDNQINDAGEREILKETIATLQRLHSEGRNHIWAYYARNIVRPISLSHSKVDVVIGNPPWINYNQTVDVLRTELERQSKDIYGIWEGRQYATQQDVAGLFFARSADLYLREGGVMGMVLPHSALQAGQYSKWRTGEWRASQGMRTLSVDFGFKAAWDLYHLNPNDFFPIPASVVFAKYLGMVGKAKPLAGGVERWQGQTGTEDVQREIVAISRTSESDSSPYASQALNGATIFPRRLFFVEEIESSAAVRAGVRKTITVNPRRGSNDNSPWKELDLTAITGQTIERSHVFDVHLGETVVPYATLKPLKAALPFRRGEYELPADENGVGGVNIRGMERLMRQRWETASRLWEGNRKESASEMNLLKQLDFYGKLSSQLEWQRARGDRSVRIVYTSSGKPTAALLRNDDALVENVLYWIACRSMAEAHYLLAIINSANLYEYVEPLMPKGQYGPRHLHKHLWRLPIPEFDDEDTVHVEVSNAGAGAAVGATQELTRIRQQRGNNAYYLTVRKDLRKWLSSSREGKRVEEAVGELLARR